MIKSFKDWLGEQTTAAATGITTKASTVAANVAIYDKPLPKPIARRKKLPDTETEGDKEQKDSEKKKKKNEVAK